MFSTTAKAKATNFGYQPNRVLNFKKSTGLLVYESSLSNFTKIKIGHAVLTFISLFSLVRAYQKNRKFRGFLIWTPLTVFCLFIMRS